MRYVALACDYDGTLAQDSRVDDATVEALRRLANSGRWLILVSGRLLEDLLDVFPQATMFDRIVAENGALLYDPATHEETVLGERPPGAFVEALRARHVDPLGVGRSIVATREPHQTTALEVIRDLGLEWQVIFNKGAVMILPAGVNKSTGLIAALDALELSPHNVVGIGDAENDHALLSTCECGVAVANALPMLKERADMVTRGDHGAGVVELIERILASDLRELDGQLARRHAILLGTDDSGQQVLLPSQRTCVLLAGPSGSGKSTMTLGIIERLEEQGYQFCLVDPEGDYEGIQSAIVLGEAEHPPDTWEILRALQRPDDEVVTNLLGVPLSDRPDFFINLLPRLTEVRTRLGRPHWIVVDEAHHLLPPTGSPAASTLSQMREGLLLITVHPDRLPREALSLVDVVIALGEAPAPEQTLRIVSEALGKSLPAGERPSSQGGEASVWFARMDEPPKRLHIAPARTERRRHVRKYAEGELGEDKSFYFRGPEGKLNLRAQNLSVFLQMADGVDDETWTYHLRRHDYSRWFREAIKDDDLAKEAARIESDVEASPAESRRRLREAIEKRYTLPA
ncbi:MAG: HAD-IIB family hydrolase [Ktedonobacterales bacterium]